MVFREKLKSFAIHHTALLKLYRNSLGKLKTKYYFGLQRKALQKNGINIIRKVEDALHKTGITYFADCGTLLGLMRNNKLIAYDTDIDFGIYLTDGFTKEMLDELMVNIGLKKRRAFIYKGKYREISYSNGITNIDFFVHEEDGSNSYLYIFYRDLNIKYPSDHYYSVLVDKLAPIKSVKRIMVDGLPVNIPENYEEYLASAYTENWRKPDPKWTYFMRPNITKNDGEYGIKK